MVNLQKNEYEVELNIKMLSGNGKISCDAVI